MISYTANTIFQDDEHQQAVVLVTSSRCKYRVVILRDEAKLYGPGVEEVYTIGEEVPDNLSFEAQAILVTTLFEEEE